MKVTRRTVMKGGLALPVLPLLAGCGNDVSAAPVLDVAVTDSGTIELDATQLPAPGRAITLRLTTGAAEDVEFAMPPGGVLLLCRGDGTFVATQAACPHQGCPLGYSATDDRIECPCHGSRFLAVTDTDDQSLCLGKVTHLPAQSDLVTYTVDQTTGTVSLGSPRICGAVPLPAVTDGRVTISTADFADLATVGGSILGYAPGLDDVLFIARTDEATIAVLSATCTHRGCPVRLDPADTLVHCDCHGSNFRYDGSVVNGPAKRALKKYATTFDATTGAIDITTR